MCGRRPDRTAGDVPLAASRGHSPSRADRGLLLVEAVICAVVIAVGLSFITRAFSNQLKALRSVQEQARLSDLAQRAWLDAEREVQAGRAPAREPEGAFEAPYEAYAWSFTAAPIEGDDADRVSAVSLTVRRVGEGGSAVTLHALWPSPLVPEAWF